MYIEFAGQSPNPQKKMIYDIQTAAMHSGKNYTGGQDP